MHKEANRTTNYLVRKDICNIDYNILWSNFPPGVINLNFKDYCVVHHLIECVELQFFFFF